MNNYYVERAHYIVQIKQLKEYFSELIEDLSDLAEDVKEHFIKKPLRRPGKIQRKVNFRSLGDERS